MDRSLTYFDFDASRGLECRLALTVAGLPFDDVRIPRQEWRARKGSFPFGALPVLTEGGRQIAQCSAILTYIGRTRGLHPSDPWTAAEHEAIMQSVEDFRHKIPLGRGMPEDEKKAAREAFAAGWMARWAQTLEDRIVGPFVEGAAINVADIKVYTILRSALGGVYDHIPPETFRPFPKLVALHAAVEAHPGVQDWLSRSQ